MGRYALAEGTNCAPVQFHASAYSGLNSGNPGPRPSRKTKGAGILARWGVASNSGWEEAQ